MPDLISAVIPHGTDSAEVIQVIRTISLKGAGTDADPARYLYQYWDLKGNLLAKNDKKKSKD